MNFKYQYLYFLLGALIKIISGDDSGFMSGRHLGEIAKLIRNLNSEHSTDFSPVNNQDNTADDDKSNMKNLLGKYLRDMKDESQFNVNEDRMCKKFGKCRCDRSDSLCNVEDFLKVANEVDRIIDDINERANRNDDNLRIRQRASSSSSSENPDNKEIYDDLLSDEKPKRNLFITELKESSESNSYENTKLSKAVIPLTPEDMSNYYRPAMDDIRKTILGFIKLRSNIKRVRGLPKTVRSGIQSLRERYRHFKMSDKALSKQIFNLLLDDVKKIRIVPNKNSQAQYDIFVPEWIYLEVLKRKEGRRLRSNKRILPLTLHQKNRMQNKQHPKRLVKFVWRRSLGADKKEYGVPFVLDVQGLGQIA